MYFLNSPVYLLQYFHIVDKLEVKVGVAKTREGQGRVNTETLLRVRREWVMQKIALALLFLLVAVIVDARSQY